MSSDEEALLKLMQDKNLSKSFLIGLIKETKKGKSRKKSSKKIKIIESYTGTITYTCLTCDTVFVRECETNIEDYYRKMSASSCWNCNDKLMELDKFALIEKILSKVKGFKVC